MDQPTSHSSKTDIEIDYTSPTVRYSVKNDNTLNEGLAYLNENGYVVISDVLNREEIDDNKNLLWKFLEDASNGQIRRGQPETWSNPWLNSCVYGVINGRGIGQSDFLWNIRSNRQVKKVYAHIWNTQQLLVSFDGCCIFRDWRNNPEWKTRSGWYHVDQNPKNKPNRCCIQGFVTLTDQNEKTGGLIVFPHSHLRFHELDEVTKYSKDFIEIPNEHSIITRGKLVHCQAGDLVLWDSRMVHCNSPATAIEERAKDEPVDLLRIVAYVSMSPTSFVCDQSLEEFRKKRKQMVENNCTLTHWSTELVMTGILFN
ncbi:unnamed protein product [Rotaria sp. Silwood1]|nr:unnamed protein product [Rotaria sp. Silwood1]CAF1618369.1 unnamed protein product [Rotaria sp. Silwood1]